jgi:hypothetical protein
MKRSLWIGILSGALVLSVSACALTGRSALPAPQEPASVPFGADEERVFELAAEAEPGAPSTGATGGATTERLIVRTADLELIVPDTDQAMQDIQNLTAELGGYVVSSSAYQYEQGVRASLTLRVPAESLDTALGRLRDLATTVRRESVSGQDVTDEYVDLESSLRHLRAVEEQLLEFLTEAEDTEAALAVYYELSRIQGEIEHAIGRMQYLQNQAALATITVSLTPDALAQPLEVGGWNLPGTVRTAVEALLGVLELFVKTLIYVMIVVLPGLVVFGLPVAGLVVLIRWMVRRARSRRRSVSSTE